MKLSKEELKMLDDYEEELKNKKKLTIEEIENLISLKETNPYESMRSLMENFLEYAYKIALEYHHAQLTTLDFVHAANEGLEIAITTGTYDDYFSLQRELDKTIHGAIEEMLRYLE